MGLVCCLLLDGIGIRYSKRTDEDDLEAEYTSIDSLGLGGTKWPACLWVDLRRIAKWKRIDHDVMRPILLAAIIVLAMFSGCFGEDVEPVQVSEFSVEAPAVSYTHLTLPTTRYV